MRAPCIIGSICSHPFVSTSRFQTLRSEALGSEAAGWEPLGGRRKSRRSRGDPAQFWSLLLSGSVAVGNLGTSVSLSVKWDSDAGTTPNKEANKEMGMGVTSRKTLLLTGSQDALLPPGEAVSSEEIHQRCLETALAGLCCYAPGGVMPTGRAGARTPIRLTSTYHMEGDRKAHGRVVLGKC